MQTAKPWGAAENRPERYAAALGKLLAVGIILVPLVMLLFPELNHRSGNTSRGRQDGSDRASADSGTGVDSRTLLQERQMRRVQRPMRDPC